MVFEAVNAGSVIVVVVYEPAEGGGDDPEGRGTARITVAVPPGVPGGYVMAFVVLSPASVIVTVV
jgi:hypothetical protein